ALISCRNSLASADMSPSTDIRPLLPAGGHGRTVIGRPFTAARQSQSLSRLGATNTSLLSVALVSTGPVRPTSEIARTGPTASYPPYPPGRAVVNGFRPVIAKI